MIDPVRAEAVRTLYLQARNSAGAAAIVTVYIVGTAWAFTSMSVILGWLAVQLTTQVLREALLRAWNRSVVADEDLPRWAHAYTAYMALAGLVWGATMFLFAHPAAPITVALTLCGLYGISSGSVPGNAYNPPGIHAFVGLIFTAVLARLLLVGGWDYAVLGFASAGFGAIMILFGRVQARTVAEGFRIRFENVALLEALHERTAEAEEARHRAEQANLSKSQFLAAASHDLRQPLYALSLFSASLDTLRLDAQARIVVQDIQRSIAALEGLFNGLLDISRLEAGAIQLRPGTVDIDALFDRLSQYFRPLAIDRGLDLRFRSNGEQIRSDGALLEQLLSNLVSNAIRCTHQGGVLIAARLRGSTLRLEIWDTGIGIAEPDLFRIFEEFVQLGNPERDRRKGLGLGLAIAQRSARLLGTEIAVHSRFGRGSRFAIAQPIAEKAAFPPAPLTPISMAAEIDLPVLIVDDDQDVRRAISGLLDRWGVRHDAVGSAEAALALIDCGHRYSIALVDFRLPGGTTGLDLAVTIIARGIVPQPAFTLITADFDVALLAAAEAQNIPVIHKPLGAEKLRSLLGAIRAG